MKYTVIVFLVCWATLLYAQDWPREVLSSEGTITMYQPQIDSYSGNSLKARAAVSILPNGKNEPVFGAIWVDCRVLTDRPTRTVKLVQMEVRRARFPSGTDADTAKIAAALEEMIPRFELTFSLDLLLESVETAQKEKLSAQELEMIPPKIIVLDHPAVLIRIDGDPILSDDEGTTLKRVVNTPYFLIQDLTGNKFYLHGGSNWFSADIIKGPWNQTNTTPQSVVDLFEQAKFDQDSNIDSTANDIMSKTGKAPEIIVSTEPTELIATDGSLQLAPIEGTGLLYASNTPSRVFLEIDAQQYFILISGRWFSAKELAGPWTFTAPDKLPADFKKIPPGSPCDDVLADVAGTLPAKEAVYDAQIPQMAEVDRAGTTTQVEYDGEPQFEPIENTGMDYAVNTSAAVIRFNGQFYVCDRGVWFASGTQYGPWEVCISVPDIIYTIPPRYPIYGVRYVRVYNYTPDFVYVGYTAGYTGCYVYGRTVVYGTGYNYHPWHRHAYYARPWTWGFNVYYDPWVGWSVNTGWGHPYGWFARPTGYAHAGWWGPAYNHPVYRSAAKPAYREGYHPSYHPAVVNAPIEKKSNDGGRTFGVQHSATIYDSRGSGIRRPALNEPIKSQRTELQSTQIPAPPQPRPMTRTVTPSIPQPEPKPALITEPRIITRRSPSENNVYAAPDGSILRSTPQGWQQRNQNSWQNASNAQAKQSTVHDSEVRQRATERTSSFSTPAPARSAPSNNSGKERNH